MASPFQLLGTPTCLKLINQAGVEHTNMGLSMRDILLHSYGDNEQILDGVNTIDIHISKWKFIGQTI